MKLKSCARYLGKVRFLKVPRPEPCCVYWSPDVLFLQGEIIPGSDSDSRRVKVLTVSMVETSRARLSPTTEGSE